MTNRLKSLVELAQDLQRQNVQREKKSLISSWFGSYPDTWVGSQKSIKMRDYSRKGAYALIAAGVVAFIFGSRVMGSAFILGSFSFLKTTRDKEKIYEEGQWDLIKAARGGLHQLKKLEAVSKSIAEKANAASTQKELDAVVDAACEVINGGGIYVAALEECSCIDFGFLSHPIVADIKLPNIDELMSDSKRKLDVVRAEWGNESDPQTMLAAKSFHTFLVSVQALSDVFAIYNEAFRKFFVRQELKLRQQHAGVNFGAFAMKDALEEEKAVKSETSSVLASWNRWLPNLPVEQIQTVPSCKKSLDLYLSQRFGTEIVNNLPLGTTSSRDISEYILQVVRARHGDETYEKYGVRSVSDILLKQGSGIEVTTAPAPSNPIAEPPILSVVTPDSITAHPTLDTPQPSSLISAASPPEAAPPTSTIAPMAPPVIESVPQSSVPPPQALPSVAKSKLQIYASVGTLLLAVVGGVGYWGWTQKKVADEQVALMARQQADQQTRKADEEQQQKLKEAEEKGRTEAKLAAEQQSAVAQPQLQPQPQQQAVTENLIARAIKCEDIKACIVMMLEAIDPRSPEALQVAATRVGELNKAQRGDRKAARALNENGLSEFKKKNLATAVDFLKQANAADPADVEIISNLGYVALQANRIEDAVTALSAALMIDPRRTSTWVPIAELYVIRGKNDNALRALLLGYEFSGNKEKTVTAYEERANTVEREAMRPIYTEALKKIVLLQKP